MNLTVTTSPNLGGLPGPLLPKCGLLRRPQPARQYSACMFLQTRYNYTTLETGGLWRRRLGLDLTYLEDYNLPDLQQRYQRAGRPWIC